ncbi:MAG: NADH-quinone oxidoreductase subunit NuoH [Chloroflexi bacterium]|nr:NADH-quinone oxidoreductase subunit NuoH [Chloroflexota bacterium]
MGELLAGNSIYRNVYIWVEGLLPTGWQWVAYFVAGFTIMFLLLNAFLVLTMVYTYMERRVLGRFQGRLGPNRVGPFGILQPVADAIKLLTKEDIVPAVADRWVFNLAPVVFFVPTVLVLGVVPFGQNSFLADLNVGILYVLALSSVSTLAVFMAGWASANRFALFGSMRAVATLISYELPVLLSMGGVLMLVGSMSLVRIVEGQRIPFLLLQPLAFLVFLAGISAELNRAPFDMVEAESELVSGFNTEYSGMKYGLFALAEFGNVLVAGAIMSVVFLKGWEGPVLPSHLWFLLKVFFFAFIFVWVRATLPRLRIDQMMGFAWKFLFPLSLVNLVVTGAEVAVWPEATTAQLWVMAVINWVVAIVGVVVFSRLVRQRPTQPEVRVFSSAAPSGAR